MRRRRRSKRRMRSRKSRRGRRRRRKRSRRRRIHELLCSWCKVSLFKDYLTHIYLITRV